MTHRELELDAMLTELNKQILLYLDVHERVKTIVREVSARTGWLINDDNADVIAYSPEGMR